MNRALYAAATGMAAQQRNLEIIADNLANAHVAGFKGAGATFTDIASRGEALGTAVAGTHVMFTQGKLERSGGPFDLAIEGAGFFAVADGAGRLAFTRDGEFSRAADGRLTNAQGRTLAGVRILADALSASVAADGTVSVQTAAGTSALGQGCVCDISTCAQAFCRTAPFGHCGIRILGSRNARHYRRRARLGRRFKRQLLRRPISLQAGLRRLLRSRSLRHVMCLRPQRNS